MNKIDVIQSFLSLKNIAVIGVSSKGKGFGVSVYRHLKERHYNVIPVNSKGGNIDGQKLETSLSSLNQKVDGVVTVIPPYETEKVLNEVKQNNIGFVWFQQGSESQEAIKFCEENNIKAVYGECIMMFAEPVKSIHSFHRFINKMMGKYPKIQEKTS